MTSAFLSYYLLMKYILLIILIFLNKFALSAEWISEATAKVSILKKIELPDSHIHLLKQSLEKITLDKQSTAICVGHRIDEE